MIRLHDGADEDDQGVQNDPILSAKHFSIEIWTLHRALVCLSISPSPRELEHWDTDWNEHLHNEKWNAYVRSVYCCGFLWRISAPVSLRVFSWLDVNGLGVFPLVHRQTSMSIEQDESLRHVHRLSSSLYIQVSVVLHRRTRNDSASKHVFIRLRGEQESETRVTSPLLMIQSFARRLDMVNDERDTSQLSTTSFGCA